MTNQGIMNNMKDSLSSSSCSEEAISSRHLILTGSFVMEAAESCLISFLPSVLWLSLASMDSDGLSAWSGELEAFSLSFFSGLDGVLSKFITSWHVSLLKSFLRGNEFKTYPWYNNFYIKVPFTYISNMNC